MEYVFIEYPKCSTCKNAKKWLEDNKIEFEDRNIITNTPNVEELNKWIDNSNIPLNKLFNTSGLIYRNLNLKEKLKQMTEQEQIALLSSNGMLIKRPILIKNDKIIFLGFKQTDWEKIKK